MTSVLEVVKMIKIWGSGKIIHKKILIIMNKKSSLNISKAKQKLKWKPYYTISQSVKTTIEWYKKVYIEKKSPKKVTVDQIRNYFDNVKKN